MGRPIHPPPGAYWLTFTTQLAIAGRIQTSNYGLSNRGRLNTDTEAHLATARDLQPIKVGHFVPHWFSLGRIGRHYLAAENRLFADEGW
jgi:hypothetical protein